MRVLIDECIDERFRNALPGHDCQTARFAGLAGLKNGDLLTAAGTAKFDVFITVDQGFRVPAKSGCPKDCNHHSPCEVEPPERPVTTCGRMPRAHRIHPTRADR